MNQIISLPSSYSKNRQDRLRRELAYALDNTSAADMSAWGVRSGRVLVGAGVRRFRNIGAILSASYEAIVDESTKIRKSDSISDYIDDRSKAISELAQSLPAAATSLWKSAARYTSSNPKKAAGQLALLCFGFGVGSGGIDGDGGIPDLDWTLFDSHRSLLTHSIVPGILVEVAVASFVDLVSTLHDKLPVDHDSLWDTALESSKELKIFALGASAGLAYHLGIDATLDGDGSYADLPFSASQTGHQIIAVIEGIDAIARTANYGDVVATYPTFNDAASAAKKSKGKSSFTIRPMFNNKGFKILWMPKRT